MSADPATEPVLARLRWAGEQPRRIVRWMQVLAPFLFVLFVVAAAGGEPGPGVRGRGLVVTGAVAAFMVGVVGRNCTTVRPGGAHLAFVVVLLVSSVVLVGVQRAGPGPEGVLVGVVCAAQLVPARIDVPALVIAFVAMEVIEGVTGAGIVDLAFLAAMAAFYGMLILAFRLGEANRQAAELLTEVQRSHAARARAAALAERQRLAREMHDVLAHSLSGLMLQLEGARMLASGDTGDPRLRQILERAHQLGRAGLDEARQAIGMLRDEELPGPQRLAGLAAQFEQDQGVPCRLDVSGEVRELGLQARLAVYRVAQEALTNVAKHARPERVELRLTYREDTTRLAVEDFASTARRTPVPPVPHGSGGYGLTGMRERAELLGGTLTAEPTDRGFRVLLDVPA